MRFEIIWHPAAVHQLKDLGWHPSESVDAAVIRFAETQRGDVEWVPPYYRLRWAITAFASRSTPQRAR